MIEKVKMGRSAKAAVWRKGYQPAPVVKEVDWNYRYSECTDSGALAMVACASTAGTTILKLIPGVGPYLKWTRIGKNRWKRMYFGEHGEANTVMWCPTDGKMLASASQSGLLSIIEYQDQRFDIKSTFKINDGESISSLIWSQDGSYLIIACKPTLELIFFKKTIANGVSSFSKLGKISYPAKHSGNSIGLCLVPKVPNLFISFSSESDRIRMWVRSKTDSVGWKQGPEHFNGYHVRAMAAVSHFIYTVHPGDRINEWIIETDDSDFDDISYRLLDMGTVRAGHARFMHSDSKTYKRSETNVIACLKTPSDEYYQVQLGTADTMMAYEGSYELRSGGRRVHYELVHEHGSHVHRGEARCIKLNPHFTDAHNMHAVHGGDGGFLNFWHMGTDDPRKDPLEMVDEEDYYSDPIPEFSLGLMPPDDESDDEHHVQTGIVQLVDTNPANDENETSDRVSDDVSVDPPPKRKRADSDDSYSPTISAGRLQSAEEESPGSFQPEAGWYHPDLSESLQEIISRSEKWTRKKAQAGQAIIAKEKKDAAMKAEQMQNHFKVFMSGMQNSMETCSTEVKNLEESTELNELRVFSQDLVSKLKQIQELCDPQNPELSEEEKAFRRNVSEICKLPKKKKFNR